MATRPAFALDRHLFFWLTQVIGARDRQLTGELKGFGLRVPEWRALAALYAEQRCTMSALAELATIDRTTLTRTVDRMQQAGWLSRLEDPSDMRITRLALTAAGKKIFERVWPTVQRLNEAATADLPRVQVDALRRTLEHMRDNLDSYAPGERHAA